MKKMRMFQAIVVITVLGAAGVAAGGEQASVTVEAGDLGEQFTESMTASIRTVLGERGYEPVETREAAAEIQASAAFSKSKIEIRICSVYRDGTEGKCDERIASVASAQSQIRAMTRKVLRKASDEARPAPEPVVEPAPEPVVEPAPEPVVEPAPVVKPEQTSRPATGGFAYNQPGPISERGEPTQPGAPPRPSDEELMVLPEGIIMAGTPAETGRVMKVFGSTVGIQAGALALTFLGCLLTWDMPSIWREDEDETARENYNYKVTRNAGIIYYALSPAISSIMGTWVANKSLYWKVSYGPIVGGAYIGALAGVGMLLYADYRKNATSGFFGYFVCPLVFPALGAAIGYVVGRKPKEGVDKISLNRNGEPFLALSSRVNWTLPSPIVMNSMDGSRRAIAGVTLGKLSF